MSTTQLTIQNDLRNKLRDLLFYVNFPLAAITASFFREVFFHKPANPDTPSLSNLNNQIIVGGIESIHYVIMAVLVFMPVIIVGISHIVFFKRSVNSSKYSDYSPLKKKHDLQTFAIETVIMLLGCLMSIFLLSPFFGQPYLFIVFLLIYGLFFFGKIIVIWSV